jgi:hypothetical protein
MSVTVNAPSSNVTVEWLDGQWNSKNSAIVKPEVRAELYKKYGAGIGTRDIIFAAGNVIDVPNQTITIGLAESPLPVVVVGTEVATTVAGGNMLLYLDASCFDANGNGPLRVGDDILVPRAYQNAACTSDRLYRVFSISTDATTAKLYTCQPYANAGTTYTVPSEIATPIPSGTTLAIMGNAFAPGTDQPSGMADTFETRTFSNRILKESLEFEGGQVAKNYYEFSGYNGNMGLVRENILRAEFRLDAKEARAFTYSEWADNAAMVQTTQASVSTAVPSFGGMLPHADVYAQKKTYSGDFVIDDLYDVGILQQSKGVVPGSANLFLVGPTLGRDLEKAILDYIKAYSGGTDLVDKIKKGIGVDVQAFNINHRTYVLWEPSEFADPTGLGALSSTGEGLYSTAVGGLVIPYTNVTVGEFNGKKNVSIPGIQLGYVSYNGENRRRVIGKLKGMADGGDVSSGYDTSKFYMLTHMTGIFAIPDQWVKIDKD